MGRKKKITWGLIRKGIDHEWRPAREIARKIGANHSYLARLLSNAAALGLVEKSKKRYRCPVCGAAFDEVKRVDNMYPLFRLPPGPAEKKRGAAR
ncbi:unnamed protein product [marine sediment metagenome]|uniref:HTH iclR-type domain-containing protein n=1 Tax=marine sediment metagenome TaxID=412755 RepID=X1K1I1_9ZZZZ